MGAASGPPRGTPSPRRHAAWGHLIKARGRGRLDLSVFERASGAVAAVLWALQRRSPPRHGRTASTFPPVWAHCTPARRELRDGDYYGPTRTGQPASVLSPMEVRFCCRGRRRTWWLMSCPLGLRRLVGARPKGLSRPEHVFALLHPDIGVTSAPNCPTTEAHVESVLSAARPNPRPTDAALEDALAAHGRLALVWASPHRQDPHRRAVGCARPPARRGQGGAAEGEGAPVYWPWIQLLRAYAATPPPPCGAFPGQGPPRWRNGCRWPRRYPNPAAIVPRPGDGLLRLLDGGRPSAACG